MEWRKRWKNNKKTKITFNETKTTDNQSQLMFEFEFKDVCT